MEGIRFKADRYPEAVGEVHLDYCFPCGAGGKPRDRREKASDATGGLTVLVLRDRDKNMMLTTVVPRKGTIGEFAAKREI